LFFIFAQAQAQSIQQTLKINTGFQVPESDVVQSLTKEIMQRNNIALIFQVLPNQRSLINANNGVDDGEAARIFEINQYYPNLLPLAEPIHEIDIVLLTKRNFKLKVSSDFSSHHAGLIRGMKIAELNQTLIKMKADGSFAKIKADFYTRFEQTLKKSVTLIPYESQ